MISLLLTAALLSKPHSSLQQPLQPTLHSNLKQKRERVVIVGSSVAEGWVDTKGGYIARALRAYSKQSGIHYVLYNEAMAGNTVPLVAHLFRHWLQFVKPQIVLISWGGMDDVAAHTTTQTFMRGVEQEVQWSLQAHAVVWLVTPPVTLAALVNTEQKPPYTYFVDEMEYAYHSRNQNVFGFNVFDQMVHYLHTHHQTLKPYEADGWHPNAKGHALAGNFLDTDLEDTFHHEPILYGHVGKQKIFLFQTSWTTAMYELHDDVMSHYTYFLLFMKGFGLFLLSWMALKWKKNIKKQKNRKQ